MKSSHILAGGFKELASLPHYRLTVEIERIRDHLRVAYTRAAAARQEAINLLEAGFPGPSLVWSVRASEILIRDFVLAPHFMLEGLPWERSMKLGAKTLGDSNWKKAFIKAEEWFGPFDQPLTTDDRNAWDAWDRDFVRIRGAVVHGRPIRRDVSTDEARLAHGYAGRMATWYAQRFLTSEKHPIGIEFREALAEIAALKKAESPDPSLSAGPTADDQQDDHGEAE